MNLPRDETLGQDNVPLATCCVLVFCSCLLFIEAVGGLHAGVGFGLKVGLVSGKERGGGRLAQMQRSWAASRGRSFLQRVVGTPGEFGQENAP